MAEGVVEIILRAVDEFSGTMNQITSASGGASNIIVQNWKNIAIAAGAAGIALEGYARMQAPLIESTNKIAIVSGLTAKAVKDLALDTADASFSLKDALSVMEEGASQGLKSGDALKTYATFWDTVGDASGENSATLANSSVSLRNFGIDAENVSDAAGAYGYILSETSLSISEFNTICARAGPSLSGMGLSIDQVAVIVDKLEEKGVTGRKAITAITDAAKDSTSLDELYGKLGITATGMDTAGASADEYAGKLANMAKSHDDVLTPMQKISSYLQELGYKFSGVISAGANLAPVLMGIAGAVPIFAKWSEAAGLAGGNMKLLGVIAGIAQGSIAGIGASLLAVAPYLIAIAAAAVILYAAWKTNFLGIQDITKKVADFVKDRWDGVKDSFAKFGDKIAPSISKIKDAFGDVTEALDKLVKKLTGSSIGEIIGKMVDLFGRLIDKGVTKFFDLLAGAIGKAADVIVIISDKIGDFLKWCDKIADHPVMKFFLGFIEKGKEAAGVMIDEMIPAADDTGKALDNTSKAADGTTGSLDKLDKQGSGSLANLATNAGTAAQTIAEKLGGVNGAISTALQKLKDANNDANNFQIELGKATMGEKGQFAQYGEGTEAQKYETYISMLASYRDSIGGNKNPDEYAKEFLTPDQYAQFLKLQQKHYSGALTGQSIPAVPVGSVGESGIKYTVDGQPIAPDGSVGFGYNNTPGANAYGTQFYEGAVDAQGIDVAAGDAYWEKAGTLDGEVLWKVTKTYYDKAKESVTEFWKYNEDAAEESWNPDSEKRWTQVMESANDAVDENTDSTKTLTKANTSLSKVLDSTSKATGTAAGSLAGWNTELVGGTQEAAELATDAVATMNTNVVNSNQVTAGNISATHEYIGRSSAASASNISGVTDGMFQNIIRSARRASAEVAAATGCADGSCGLPAGLSSSTGGAGSPIVFDGTSSYGGATISTGYSYTPIRSTVTRTTSDRYATSRYAVPAMASGGEVIGGGSAIVGENGAEFVELPDGARVTPLKGNEDDFVSRIANKILAKIGNQSSGRGGGDIHVHGVFIADRSGLMKLNKEIEKVKVLENNRRGRGVTS